MADSATRTIQGIGWLLVIAAALILVGIIGYALLFSGEESSWVGWVVGALYLGFGVLLLSVLRQRLIDRKSDRYKDVDI